MTPGFNVQAFRVESNDGRNFTLVEPVIFTRPCGEEITIPVGAQSDGASTPAIMWPTLPPFGTYWKAAYLHDYLYRYTQRTKEGCDTILKEAMRSLGVGEIDIIVIYEGVTIGGEESFKADRAAQ